MAPKKGEPSKPKSEGDKTPKSQAPKPPRRLLPARPKPRINHDGTITQVQEYIPGYGPSSRRRIPAASLNPAVRPEPSGPPRANLSRNNRRGQHGHVVQDRVTSAHRAGNLRPAVPSSGIGMMGPPPPPGLNDRVPQFPSWNGHFDRMFRSSGPDQGLRRVEPPSILTEDAGAVFNDARPGLMGAQNPFVWPFDDNRHVHAPNAFFSPGPAPAFTSAPAPAPAPALASYPGGYNGVVAPSSLQFVPETAQYHNGTPSAYPNQGPNNTAVNFGFDLLPPQTQQQQLQPPLQAQDTYLGSAGNRQQQQPSSYMPNHTTNYPPGQLALPLFIPPYINIPLQRTSSYTNIPLQQPSPYLNAPLQPQQQQQAAYIPPYANYYEHQYQSAPETAQGYPETYAPTAQFNNVAGNNNIVVNYTPSGPGPESGLGSSSSSSQNPTTAFHLQQQNELERLRLEVAGEWMRAAEQEEGVFAQPKGKN